MYVCRKCFEMHTNPLDEYTRPSSVDRHFTLTCQHGPSSTPQSNRTSPPPASPPSTPPPEKSNSPSNRDIPTDTKEDPWIRLDKSDYVCRECHRHNERLLKHYGGPGQVITHFESECKYGPISTVQSTPTSTPPISPSGSQSSTANSDLAPNGQSRSTNPCWLGLRQLHYVCKECFRHDEEDLTEYKTCALVSDHFQTECKYGPSSMATPSNSQPFDFTDHDSFTHLQFRRKFYCERVDYPVAIELKSEESKGPRSFRRKQRSRWTCRHCQENGAPMESWSNEKLALNHWNQKCYYNPRVKRDYSKGPQPVVQVESQVCPALGYANL
jgi:hypothetical protein